MARKKYVGVDLEGGVFDQGIAGRIAAAINEGLEQTGDEAAGVLTGFIAQSGFVKTGAFMRSVDSKLLTKSADEPGYVKVAVEDAWPNSNRPTRTWAETGTRGGRKLRRGLGVFSKTNRRVGDFSFANIEAAIQKVLD